MAGDGQYRLLWSGLARSRKANRCFPENKWLRVGCHLVYTWLLPWQDDDGRMRGEPLWVLANVLPNEGFTTDEIVMFLTELHRVELITWYEIKGEWFIEITNHEGHQKIRKDRYRPSIYPPPPTIRQPDVNQIPTKWQPTPQNPTNTEIPTMRADGNQMSTKYQPSGNPLPSPSPSPSPSPKKDLFRRTSDEVQLSELLFSLIKERDTKAKKPDYQKWSIEIDKLIRIDNRDPTQIKEVIIWCQKNDFWQNNVLSTKSLRKHFTALVLKMKGENNGKRDSGSTRQPIAKAGRARSDDQPYPIDFEVSE